jgi:hypothetical protein
MSRRFYSLSNESRRSLSACAHLVELRHEARFSARGIVLMDNMLTGNSVEHTQRVTHCKRGNWLIAVLDRKLSLFHVRAGGRNVWPVALATTLANPNALFGGFAICQLEFPLASWLQIIKHTPKHGVTAATGRWYQTKRKSTTSWPLQSEAS